MIGEAIVEIIGRVIAEFVVLFIFRYPGAFYMWVFTGFREPFKHWLNIGDGMASGTVGLIVTVLIIALIAHFT